MWAFQLSAKGVWRCTACNRLIYRTPYEFVKLAAELCEDCVRVGVRPPPLSLVLG